MPGFRVFAILVEVLDVEMNNLKRTGHRAVYNNKRYIFLVHAQQTAHQQ